jgi:hypothetical protein
MRRKPSSMRLWEWYGRFVVSEQSSRSRDDISDANGAFDDVESKMRDLICRDGAEGCDDQDVIRWNDRAHFIECLARLRQALQIDNQQTRLHPGSEVLPRNRPRVGGNDIVSFFKKLSAQQRTLRPFGTEQDDFRRIHDRT